MTLKTAQLRFKAERAKPICLCNYPFTFCFHALPAIRQIDCLKFGRKLAGINGKRIVFRFTRHFHPQIGGGSRIAFNNQTQNCDDDGNLSRAKGQSTNTLDLDGQLTTLLSLAGLPKVQFRRQQLYFAIIESYQNGLEVHWSGFFHS
jgi:hypothetical protein